LVAPLLVLPLPSDDDAALLLLVVCVVTVAVAPREAVVVIPLVTAPTAVVVVQEPPPPAPPRNLLPGLDEDAPGAAAPASAYIEEDELLEFPSTKCPPPSPPPPSPIVGERGKISNLDIVAAAVELEGGLAPGFLVVACPVAADAAF